MTNFTNFSANSLSEVVLAFVEFHKKELEGLKKEKERLSAKIIQLAEVLEETKKERDAYASSNLVLERQTNETELKYTLTTLQAENDRLQKQLRAEVDLSRSLTIEVNDLKLELEKARAGFNPATVALDVSSSANSSLEKEIDWLRGLVKNERALVDDLRKDLELVNKENNDMSELLARYKADLCTYPSLVTILDSQLKKAHEQIDNQAMMLHNIRHSEKLVKYAEQQVEPPAKPHYFVRIDEGDGWKLLMSSPHKLLCEWIAQESTYERVMVQDEKEDILWERIIPFEIKEHPALTDIPPV